MHQNKAVLQILHTVVIKKQCVKNAYADSYKLADLKILIIRNVTLDHSNRVYFKALSCHGIFKSTRIFYSFRSFEHFKSDKIAIFIIINDYARFVLVAFLYGVIAK